MTKTLDLNGFESIKEKELLTIDGGVIPILFVVWGVNVTIVHCLAAGAAIGLTAGAMVALKG